MALVATSVPASASAASSGVRIDCMQTSQGFQRAENRPSSGLPAGGPAGCSHSQKNCGCIHRRFCGVLGTGNWREAARPGYTGFRERPMSNDPHADLLAACGRGDRGALASIYQRAAAAILGVALRIVRRRELAEEVVHDAFVQIWRHAARYDPALGSGRGWVFAIVRNRALNALRDTNREQPQAEGQITQ